jgi:hypothetical protein
MSTAVDTLLAVSGWSVHPDLPSSVEIVARGGRGGRTFFFFGGGGSAIFAVPILLIAAAGGYLMRNPDKARGLKERIKGAWGASTTGLSPPRPPRTPSNYYLAPPPGQAPPPTSAPPPTWAPTPPSSPTPPSWVTGGVSSGHRPTSPPVVSATSPATSPPTIAVRHPAPAPAVVSPARHAKAPVAATRSAMQFNPPPQWPVPTSGWTPDADWKPDDSWPAAPPGWQFWVPIENVPMPATQRFAAGTTYTGSEHRDRRPPGGGS